MPTIGGFVNNLRVTSHGVGSFGTSGATTLGTRLTRLDDRGEVIEVGDVMTLGVKSGYRTSDLQEYPSPGDEFIPAKSSSLVFSNYYDPVNLIVQSNFTPIDGGTFGNYFVHGFGYVVGEQVLNPRPNQISKYPNASEPKYLTIVHDPQYKFKVLISKYQTFGTYETFTYLDRLNGDFEINSNYGTFSGCEVLPLDRKIKINTTVQLGLRLSFKYPIYDDDPLPGNPQVSAGFNYQNNYNVVVEAPEVDGVTVDDLGRLTVTDSYKESTITVTVTQLGHADRVATATFDIVTENGDPYGQGGNSGTGGGGGNYGEGSDGAIGAPNGSVVTDTSHTGIYTMYGVTIPVLTQVGAALFSSSFLESVIMELNKIIYGSPIDATISLMAFPFSLPTSGTETIKYGAGNLTIWKEEDGVYVPGNEIVASTVPSSMRIDWGSVQISEFWGNFLDYAPHTKIELYLPWGGGTCQIDPSDVMNGAIEIVTNVDLTKGTCVHNIYGKGKNIGSFGGNCGHPLPISALDTSGKALGIVASGIALAATAGFSGAAQSAGIAAGVNWRPPSGSNMTFPQMVAGQEAVIARAEAPYRTMQRGAAGVASASALAAARSPIQFPRSGSFGTSSAGLGIQIPYLLISRPVQNYPANYGGLYGYPSNITRTLGSLSGYTEVAAIHLDGIVCSEDERNEIYELLRGGVIL